MAGCFGWFIDSTSSNFPFLGKYIYQMPIPYLVILVNPTLQLGFQQPSIWQSMVLLLFPYCTNNFPLWWDHNLTPRCCPAPIPLLIVVIPPPINYCLHPIQANLYRPLSSLFRWYTTHVWGPYGIRIALVVGGSHGNRNTPSVRTVLAYIDPHIQAYEDNSFIFSKPGSVSLLW